MYQLVDQVIKYSPKKVEPKKDEKLFENINNSSESHVYLHLSW